ncbi:hypothetical protein D3C85_1228440 [compost metagenome]
MLQAYKEGVAWIFCLDKSLKIHYHFSILNRTIASDSKPQSPNSRLSPMNYRLKKLFSRIKKLNTRNGIKQNLVGIYYCSYCCSRY